MSKGGVIRLGVRHEDGRTTEVGHFIFDIRDQALRERAVAIYGEKPTELNIAFFSNRREDVYYCGHQKWGMRERTPYLVCEGDGRRAISNGRERPCPCPAFGRECRKTTLLKFLIPDVAVSYYFRLVTKSDHSAGDIESSLLQGLPAPGGLRSLHFKLKRTEGYARVRGAKTRKYYVALECYQEQATPKAIKDECHGLSPISSLLPMPAALAESDNLLAKREREERLKRGRKRVREKLMLHILNPNAEAALEAYARERFGRSSFDELTVEELLTLFHDLEGSSEVVNAIYEKSLIMS